MNRAFIWAGALALVSTAATGCTYPRVVRGITSRGDSVKFLYQQNKFLGSTEQGVIRCKVGAEGALSDCRNMTVTLED